jgi:hypothetical protein
VVPYKCKSKYHKKRGVSMKHEWRKAEKNIYIPKSKPTLIELPEQKFFMIDGSGDPNGELFAKHIEVLYALSYAIRMMPKSGFTPDGYFEYTVYPLEGIWDISDDGKSDDVLDKSKLIYTLMIRQPDFVTQELFEKALSIVKKKKKSLEFLDKVRLSTMCDGLSVQMLHLGSYDNEPESFGAMKLFIEEHNLEILTMKHREIYLNDARKTIPEKLKTTLRYRVKKL